MPLIEVDDVHVGYDGAEVLHGVSLSVERGEVVTIIGPNGAGKSTLLKAVMGYALPSSGHVRFDGADITRLRPEQRVARGLAYVPQLDNVFPSLSVEENLRIGGYRLARNEVPGRTEVLYRQFPRLAERRRQRVRTMSGGERQMLALARALMTGPELLMLDEPSAALSPRMAGEIFDQVAAINAEGTTLVIVEQEAQRSLEVSSRCYVLVDGRNAFEGRAGEVLKDPKLREAYLGASSAG